MDRRRRARDYQLVLQLRGLLQLIARRIAACKQPSAPSSAGASQSSMSLSAGSSSSQAASELAASGQEFTLTAQEEATIAGLLAQF